MAIAVNDLRAGAVFQDSAGVWQVETFNHVKMGRGNAVIKVKVRNLKSGAITEKSFTSGNKVDEADVVKRKGQYLYSDENFHYFMDIGSFEQFSLMRGRAEKLTEFVKEGSVLEILVVAGEAAGVEVPKNVALLVTDADPSERGNSVSNLLKSCTVETGLRVQVPLFVKVGDTIKVDTRSGEYLERS
jgi:elongation factor P